MVGREGEGCWLWVASCIGAVLQVRNVAEGVVMLRQRAGPSSGPLVLLHNTSHLFTCRSPTAASPPHN